MVDKMPSLTFKLKKHTIEVSTSYWTSVTKVRIDGVDVVKKFHWLGKNFIVDVDKTPVTIDISALGTIKAYVAGRLIASA